MSTQFVTTSQNFIPPAPTPPPAIEGDIPLLVQLDFLRKVVKNPIETFSDASFEQGVLQFKFFGVTNTQPYHPALIRHCYVENAANYNHDIVRQKILRPALRDGLLTAEGPQWKRERKALAPIFTPRHVDHFADMMRNSAQAYANKLAKNIPAAPIALSEQMSWLTYDILSETLFSGEISEDSEAMLSSVALFIKTLGKPDPLDIMRAPDWIPRLTKLRGLSALRQFRKTVAKTMATREAQIKAVRAGQNARDIPQDFLTLLLTAGEDGEGLTREEVEDNIITFIGAGHETTAKGLTWLLYLLSQSPDALHKVEAEIDALDVDKIAPAHWIDHLPWTKACFEEALRLYPPATFVTRAPKEDDFFEDEETGPVHIPAGSLVMLNLWSLHRHKKLWQHPEQFDPTRFMGENRSKIDRFAYLPFGLGQHVCIGASFAMQEAVIILATLLRRVRFSYAGKKAPWPTLKLTLQPDNGMPMQAELRG